MIENVIVIQSKWELRDIPLLFDDQTIWFTQQTMLPNLLKELNIYPSTSDAIRAGRKGEIPKGWTELKASKKRNLWIWNPQ